MLFGAAAMSSMDALEDTSEDCLWQWELRDVKAIPKALKPAARAHKKLMHKVRSPHISLKSAHLWPGADVMCNCRCSAASSLPASYCSVDNLHCIAH